MPSDKRSLREELQASVGTPEAPQGCAKSSSLCVFCFHACHQAEVPHDEFPPETASKSCQSPGITSIIAING